MNTLPELLERLLTDATFRAAFIEGRAEVPDALRTIDPVQIERTAAQLKKDLAERQFRGSGGLAARFPATVAACPGDEIYARFIGSPAYRAYREWPRSAEGQCLEEAFYRFAEVEQIGDAVMREVEFLEALVRAVLLSPDPGFSLPPELVVRPNGVVFALATRGPKPRLFAATPRGLVKGELSPFLADLLGAETVAVVSARHRVTPEVSAAAVARFVALGLLNS